MFHGEFKLSGRLFSGGTKEKGRKELMPYALSRCSQGKCSQNEFCFSFLCCQAICQKTTCLCGSGLETDPAAPALSTCVSAIYTQGFLCREYVDFINEQLAHVQHWYHHGLSFLFLQLRRSSAPGICMSASTATALCDSRGCQLQGG